MFMRHPLLYTVTTISVNISNPTLDLDLDHRSLKRLKIVDNRRIRCCDEHDVVERRSETLGERPDGYAAAVRHDSRSWPAGNTLAAAAPQNKNNHKKFN